MKIKNHTLGYLAKLRSTTLFFLVLMMLQFVVLSFAFAEDGVDANENTEKSDPTEAAEPKAEAEVEKKEKKDSKYVFQKGVIASFGDYSGSAAVNATTSDKVSGEKLSPISGSVHRKGDYCIAVVSNISKDSSYSVSFKVVGTDKRGQNVLSRSYSASLKPGGSTEKEVSCDKEWSMQVVLTSGRKSG